ncbi:MAG: histidine kinase dimerization/phospho-acceptor domain-containing protein, partial [Verrucomicrobiae bacterium]|nr:histidine kinase dimerization/phospho-acceptor domain-containing protein [Verrucomicrobiae bacterium]
MIPKSIKWRLQIWYGLILVVVLAGFGVMAYQLERGRQIRRVDDELHRRFMVLIKVLRPGPPQLERPPLDQPPQGRQSPDRQPRDDRQSRDRNLDNRPREQTPDDFFPPPEGQNLEPFTLPVYAASLFDTNQPDEFYFVIHSRDHQEIARGGHVPGGLDANFTPASLTNRRSGPDNPKPPSAWTQDGFREVFESTPAGTEVLVGCSLQPEFRELRLTALHLATVGGLILLVGLAGGWWLVGRALQPIEAISATATKIAAGDLSQRINSAEAESELGRLAAVLNSTFARLETAFAQQKQFASDAAHELRTPVTVILTQTQLALGRDRDAAGYKQTVEACQRAAQRMRKLIESLLELARFDAGQEVLNRLRL